MKTTSLKDDVWESLTKLKLEWRCPSINDVIQRLLDESKDELTT